MSFVRGSSMGLLNRRIDLFFTINSNYFSELSGAHGMESTGMYKSHTNILLEIFLGDLNQ